MNRATPRSTRRMRAALWLLIGFLIGFGAPLALYAGTGAPAGGSDLMAPAVLAGLALAALMRR